MSESVLEPVSELVSQRYHAVMGGATVRAGIAAVFHEADRRIRSADHLIAARIERKIKPLVACSAGQVVPLERQPASDLNP